VLFQQKVAARVIIAVATAMMTVIATASTSHATSPEAGNLADQTQGATWSNDPNPPGATDEDAKLWAACGVFDDDLKPVRNLTAFPTNNYCG
jgi:hypothetical protein